MITVKLVLDNRELKLKPLLSSKHIFQENEIVLENLKCGDIVMRVDDIDEFIFERKTVADLAASIIDGRYRTQKNNLLSSYTRQKIYYIIEGDIPYNDTEVGVPRIDKKTIHGAIINTTMRDDIRIFYTKDERETAFLVTEIFIRILKDPDIYKGGANPRAEQITTMNTQHIVARKDPNMSKRDFFISQLCQVPGISDKSAAAIVERYKTFAEFFMKLSRLPYIEKLNALKDITTVDKKGTHRRIASSTIANIILYIFE
jgi:ERCC4-type nuclease